jgi:tetratricopeptide (TPR) repeat protein
MRLNLLPTSCFLVLGLLLAGCGTSSTIERSQAYAANGNYYMAFMELDRARDPGRPDPVLDKAWQQARFEYLIQEARDEIFADREDRALAVLAKAEELKPDCPVIKKLVVLANQNQAKRDTLRGDELLLEGDLPGGLLAYTDAQRHVPGYRGALDGVQRVRLAYMKLHAKAQEHFLEALRRFPELRWVEVDWHAHAAIENDPNRDDVRDLSVRAERKLAAKAFARGQTYEKAGRYGAALAEYLSVRSLQPDYAGIDDIVAQMRREVEAQALLDRAYGMTLMSRFTDATELLDKASALSSLERAVISDLQLQVRKKEGQLRYQQAKDLELQEKKEEALAAYKVVAADWPDGLVDEKVRIDNLTRDIDNARQAIEAAKEAEAKGDLKTAVERYEAADSYYPGWQGVRQKLKQLKEQLQGSGGNGAGK